MSFWAKLQVRRKLIQTFKSGQIYLGDLERPIFPKIHAVNLEKDTTITFSLPRGLDPKLIKKNFYVFQQYFGEKIELKGEIKKFELIIHTAVIPSVLRYDYAAFKPLLSEVKLPIVAGIQMNGELVVYDMVKNPHLLIAGETGSGKSTQIRSVLATLIQSLPPERLELYLCDLKRSEFHVFRNIEHVRGVYVSPKEILPVFLYLQTEMKRRGDLLDYHELAHVDDLPEPPPYIVICIDEVALLQNEKDIMYLVEEISAIGRALGVFLILSMQRPDRKVLDGKLKNNLTVRMGFKCADLINSRIIGTPGSEKLKQEGRMLLKLPIYSEPNELQAPFLALGEAKKILEEFKTIKTKNTKKTPSRRFDGVLETKETEPNIFEVLDE